MEIAYFGFCLLLDLLVFLTIPLYIFIIYVTWKTGLHEAGRSFLVCLKQMSCCLLVQCVVSIFVNELPNLGVEPEVFIENAWWLGKISQIGMVSFFIPSAIWTFVLAYTRLSVVRNMSILDRETTWMSNLVLISWGLSILTALPIVYPIKTEAFKKFGDSYTFQMNLNLAPSILALFYRVYTMIPQVMVGLTILIYVIILVFYLPRIAKIKSSKSIRTYNVTIAAMMSCTGGLIVIIVVSVEVIPWLLLETRIWSEGTFYLLYKLGSDVHCIAIAWITLFMFRKLRRRLLEVLGVLDPIMLPGSTRQASKSNPSNTRTVASIG